MMNLTRLMKKGVLLIWIGIFYSCLMKQEVLQKHPLKLIQDTEAKVIIKKLEENLTAPIWLEKQSILHVIHRERDLKYYQHCKKLDSIGLESQIHSFTLTMMKKNPPLLYGHTNTAGNTLTYGKKEIQ